MRSGPQSTRLTRARRCIVTTFRVSVGAGPLFVFWSVAFFSSPGVIAQELSGRFVDNCFSAVGPQAEPGGPADWQQRLRKVAGHNSAIQPSNPRTGQGCRFNGLAQLSLTWTDDTLLRLQLRPNQHFNLHLFHGDRGATIRYDAGLRAWSVYVTTRVPDAPRPSRLTLAATDHSRSRRTEFDEPVPIALHYRNGELVLTRGDIVLLGAPFSGLPQEVYLDGRAEIQAMDVLHCVDLPTANTAEHSKPIRPESMRWTSTLGKGATFQSLSSGGVRLTGLRAEESGWVTTAIPQHGPRQLVLRLDHVTPGTGIFLAADESGQPQSVIHFVRNQRDGRTCVVLSDKAQLHQRDWEAMSNYSIPYVDDTVWVRIAFGAGNLRWWFSIDGNHWAEAEQPLGPLKPHCSQLGLFHVRGAEQCHIELGLVEVRAFPTLASCCDLGLQTQALAVIDHLTLDKNLSAWNESLAATCPPDAEPESWSLACAVTALGVGCAAQLGADLLNQLMDAAAEAQWPVTRQLQLFEEVGLLADSHRLATRGPTLPERYFQLGTRAWRHDGVPPFRSIRRALMESSLERHGEVVWSIEGVIREQILDLVYQGQWAELRDQCRVLDYFGLFCYDPLIVWADQLSSSQLQEEPIIVGRRVPTISWHPLLSEELNRDAYNHIVVLDGLLKSGTWDEAARHVTNPSTQTLRGVAPAPDDSALLTSPLAAIRAALLRYPQLVAQMEDDYGELVQLRVERAIQLHQVPVVTQLIELFPGLRATRHAETWLADQLLARGQPAEALGYYLRAVSEPVNETTANLKARIRIAAALSGQPLDLPIDANVRLGRINLSPAELDALTAELLQHRRGELSQVAARGESLYASGRLSVGNRTALQLAVGKEPGKEVLPGVDRLRVDWPGRQLAAVRAGDQLLVHNRFELVALDWSTGESRWTSHPMGEPVLLSRDWPLIPMRPLVQAHRVFARHLNAEAPQLAGWELNSGKLLWTSPEDQQIPISDPFVIDKSLAILTMDKQRTVDAVLHLQIIDPETGRYSRTTSLLRVRDNWWQRLSCQVLADSNRLYVLLGGLSFSCDSTGDILWIRSTPATPPGADPTWISQVHQPPLLLKDSLILAQVGVRAIEAVDPATGVLQWRTVMPHLQQLLGNAGKLLIVKTQDGLSALHLDTGKIQWAHTDTHLLLGACCNGRDGIVYTRSHSQPGEGGKQSLQLVRLDARTGFVRDSFTLDQLAGSNPQVGPLIVGDDRTWVFFSAGALGGQREMIELLGELPVSKLPDSENGR